MLITNTGYFPIALGGHYVGEECLGIHLDELDIVRKITWGERFIGQDQSLGASSINFLLCFCPPGGVWFKIYLNEGLFVLSGQIIFLSVQLEICLATIHLAESLWLCLARGPPKGLVKLRISLSGVHFFQLST